MTSSVFATLSAAGVEVVDIEQIVLRRRLVLGVLVTAPRDWKKLRDAVEQTAAASACTSRSSAAPATTSRAARAARHVTVLGTPLKAAAMAAIAGRIADTGANIDRIERMARYPVTAIELHVSGADPETLRPCWPPRRRSRTSTSPSSRPPAAPGQAADRDGRRLDADPGRGDRDARRARRLRGRGRRGHRGGDARRARLRATPCATGSRCSRACDERALDEVYDALELAPGRPHAGAHAAAARLPVRDRQRRVHPDHRPARRRPRHRLRRGQQAGDRRRHADRAGRRRHRRPAGQGRRAARFAAEVGVPLARRSRSATAPTTSTCSTPPGLGIAFNAKPVVREAADTR